MFRIEKKNHLTSEKSQIKKTEEGKRRG